MATVQSISNARLNWAEIFFTFGVTTELCANSTLTCVRLIQLRTVLTITATCNEIG